MNDWSHQGISILLTQAGEFKATVKGVDITAPSLADLKAKIEEELKNSAKAKLNLPVLGILATDSSAYRHFNKETSPKAPIKAAVLLGINRTTGELLLGGVAKGLALTNVVPDTPACRAHLERLQKARAEMEAVTVEHKKMQLSPQTYRGRLELATYEKALFDLKMEYTLIKNGEVPPGRGE